MTSAPYARLASYFARSPESEERIDVAIALVAIAGCLAWMML